jgi:hypothetical protein
LIDRVELAPLERRPVFICFTLPTTTTTTQSTTTTSSTTTATTTTATTSSSSDQADSSDSTTDERPAPPPNAHQTFEFNDVNEWLRGVSVVHDDSAPAFGLLWFFFCEFCVFFLFVLKGYVCCSTNDYVDWKMLSFSIDNRCSKVLCCCCCYYRGCLL